MEGPPRAPRYASDSAPVSSLRGFVQTTDSFEPHSGRFIDLPEHLHRQCSHAGGTVDCVDIEAQTSTLTSNSTILQTKLLEGTGDVVYDLKEENASDCCKQMLTFSSLIVLIQVIIMGAMIMQGTHVLTSPYSQSDNVSIGGIVSYKENPMYGPSAYTMVLFGAKQGALIVYRKEVWRLLTPVMLHAGLLHLISNVAIQLFVGGYLNIAYGTPQFLAIYIVSGVFGNMLSCIVRPDTISVGSSGAVLGILTSWLVWIIFRWNKIPIVLRTPRNIQLVVVVGAITITMAFSFSGSVDWAAHIGGGTQGFLLGLALLSSELDNCRTKVPF